MFELTDRVAVVTGAAHGIGRATALALAEQGANVAVTDVADGRDEVADEVAKLGVDSVALDVDVTDLNEVREAVEEIESRLGDIEVLVNNAGIFPTHTVSELSREEWDHVIDVNLNGTFNWTHEVVPGMIEQQFGRIVNISSLSGGHIGWSGKLPAYAASKGGIVGFTRSAAIDLAGQGVTMNCIAPGMIDTGAPQEANTEEELEGAIAMTPAGRMGDPEEIAATVAFLSSDEAAYVTGSVVVVDGGYSLI